MNAVIARQLPPPSLLLGSVGRPQRLVFIRPNRRCPTSQSADLTAGCARSNGTPACNQTCTHEQHPAYVIMDLRQLSCCTGRIKKGASAPCQR